MNLDVNGHQYVTSGPLNAFAQLALARKLAPGIPVLGGMVSDQNKDKDKSLLSLLMLAKLDDADAEYVVRTCLSVVNRVDGGKAAPLMARGGGVMFDDVTMPHMLEIAMAVIEENLGDFFRSALANLDRESTAKT